MSTFTCRFLAGILLVMSCFSTVINAKQYHVTVNGSDKGNGTIASPWNLAKGLNSSSGIKGGDTLMIHGGTYRGNFNSTLAGSSNNYIVVTNYENQNVILDGNTGVKNTSVLKINGQYTIFKNLEVLTSTPNRISSTNANITNDIINCDGVNIYGPYNKCINLIVHDVLGIGIGMWSTAIDAEIYGCILYNNGWVGPGRGLGHNMYMQNETGTKTIQNCMIFNSASQGINMYTENGSIKGFNIDQNTIFNNGCLGRLQLERNILIGGYQPASAVNVSDNVLYHSSNRPGFYFADNLQLGYGVKNDEAVITSNYIVGGCIPLHDIFGCTKLTVKSNTIIGFSNNTNLVQTKLTSNANSFVWDENEYYLGRFNDALFTTWTASGKVDSHSSYNNTLPTQNKIFIRPNKYDAGRGHVTIFNWEKKNEVQINLSSILKSGDKYEVYDIQNIKGQPVLKGTWNGNAVQFPMNLTAVSVPSGNAPTTPPHTTIEFGTFLVVKTNSVSTSIDDTTENDAFKLNSVYPNPVRDIVNISYNSADASVAKADIFDMNGKNTISLPFNSQSGENNIQIDMSNQRPGIYILKLTSGGKSFTSKIVKPTN